MKQWDRMGSMVAVAALLAVAQGCTHWVVIRSSPAGARARIDGVEMGKTPFFLEETTGWSKTYRLELEKEGFEPVAVTLEQNSLQWRYACPAACLCPPTLGLSLTGCLFSYGLADEYEFALVPLDDSRRARPSRKRDKDDDGTGPSPSPPGDNPGRKEQEEPPAVIPF